MSRKNSAIRATLILGSLVTFAVHNNYKFKIANDQPCSSPNSYRIVAAIGIVWFKRTNN